MSAPCRCPFCGRPITLYRRRLHREMLVLLAKLAKLCKNVRCADCHGLINLQIAEGSA